MILSIPWLVLAIILYNVIAFSSSWPPPGADGVTVFNDSLMSVGVISGATWTLTVGDFVTIVTLILLFVELIKATRTGGSSIVDHALSMILFMICLVEFLVVRQAATSVFFFILVVTLIDVIAGFSITIRAARRDFGFGGVGD
jgi:O-antigen ligase